MKSPVGGRLRRGGGGCKKKTRRFSCWNKTDSNYQFLIVVKQIPFRELVQCRIAADRVIDGKVPDPNGGATHYYAASIKAPAWGGEGEADAQAGRPPFL